MNEIFAGVLRMLMKKLALMAAILSTIVHAQAEPILVRFTGVQFFAPAFLYGAQNAFNIAQGQSISGSFTVDTEGVVFDAPTPQQKLYTNAIKRFTFEGIERELGSFKHDSYNFDPASATISFTVWDEHDGNVYDSFELVLAIKESVISDSNFNLADLKQEDIVGLGELGTGSRWTAQRATVFSFSPYIYEYAGYGGFITSVSVSTIAEPGTTALILMGLAVAGALGSKGKGKTGRSAPHDTYGARSQQKFGSVA